MRQDLALSFLFHFIIIIAMVIITPFQPRIKTDFSEVITVRLASLPIPTQTEQIEPVVIPQMIEADEPIAFIPEAKAIEKAKPVKKEPKPKTRDKPYKPLIEKGPEEKVGLENGQKDVSDNLAPGSRFGGAVVDNVSFDYHYWFVQAFSKIERSWSNPVYANQRLTCTIYFQVIRSGRIINKYEIEKSSGIDAFDRACERAVKLSQPLPPLPDDFAEEIIGLHLEFTYMPK